MVNISRRSFLKASSAIAAVCVLPKYANASEFSFKFGNDVPLHHPSTLRAQEAAERIFKETDGRLKITVFPASQLGTDTDCLSQVRSGALEFFSVSGLIISTLLPVASITAMGFAFKNYDEVWHAADGALGAYLRGQMEKVGLIGLEKKFDSGFRVTTTSKGPINGPGDFNNLKLRVPPTPLYTSMFRALGAAPTVINFTECYSALQTHVADGQENPLSLIELSRFYEVQKYCSITNHAWDGWWNIVNAKAFNRLPPRIRESVEKNFAQAAIDQRADIQIVTQASVKNLEKNGMSFAYPDVSEFRKVLSAKGFYAEWKEKFGQEAWANLEKSSGPLT